MASGINPVSSDSQGLHCPICLDVYTAPKTLPCLHTYCQHCLYKYIVKNVPEGNKSSTFSCPECRNETFAPLPGISVDKWAEHYPYNIVFLSVLPPEKRKVDNKCDSCLCEGNSVRATHYCTVCKETLCPTCNNKHKNNTSLSDHTVVNIQGFFTDPELAVNLSVSVTCSKHVGKEYEFYCKSHSCMCCSECFYASHRDCFEVLQLNDHSERLLKGKQANKILDRLKQLKFHLDQFQKENEREYKKIETEVENIPNEIEEIRKKINNWLDDLKAKVILEKNAILKEESLVRNEENQQCESISSAITGSLHLLETVLAHGNSLHILTILHRTEEQLIHYESAVKEKYFEVRHVDVKLCPDDCLLSFIKSKIATTDIVENKHSLTASCVPLSIKKIARTSLVGHDVHQTKKRDVESYNCLSSKPPRSCQTEITGQFNVDFHGIKGLYYHGITCLSDGNFMLVETYNSVCRLYDSYYQHLADYKLTSGPLGVCEVEGSQVAVTLPEENKIQLLTVDRSIQPGKIINTSLSCDGIAALSRDRLVLSGSRKGILYWCIVSIDGSEESSVRICSTSYYSCLAVNNSKTRICVACYKPAAVYAYNLDGTLIFRYEHPTIKRASGIALDMENTLYVVCSNSNRIHRVSPNGTTLQVFSTGIPQDPGAICFMSSGDEFFLVSNNKLVFKLKLI